MATAEKTGKGYGQYCPLALAAELLCRRWTILVVSRLIDGCSTFSEIHQGVPRISPSLLSTRLSELEHANIVERRKKPGSSRSTYQLTEAGRDLTEIVDKLAVWGQHWARDNEMDDFDLAFLAWSIHLRMDTASMPPGRTVMQFEFSGTPTDFRRFWLVSDKGAVDMCLKDPGFETDLLIQSDLRCFVETWRGFRDIDQEIRRRSIRLTGPKDLSSTFPKVLLLSSLAKYGRKKSGTEKRLFDSADRQAE